MNLGRSLVGLLFGMANGLHNPLEWIRLIRTNFRRLVILIVGGVVLLAGILWVVMKFATRPNADALDTASGSA